MLLPSLKAGHLYCPICVSEFPPYQRETHAATKKHTRAIDNSESLYKRESDLK